MKLLDMLLFGFVAILVIYGFISISMIKSNGGKCVTDPIVYGIKDIEKNVEGVIDCTCSFNGTPTTHYNSSGSDYIGQRETKEYYYVNIDEINYSKFRSSE
jgi:hypothetical protein